MSKLRTADVFNGIRLLKKLGAIDLINRIYEQSAGKPADEFGRNLIFALLDAATEANGEKELYGFLSRPFGVPAKQIPEMDADVFLEKVKETANLREWVDFFTRVVGMLKGT